MRREAVTWKVIGGALMTAILTGIVGAAFGAVPNEERIKPHPKNPFYWQYKGEPVLLLGGSDDDNLFQWTGEKLRGHLDLLKSVGGNYVRCTMSSRDPGNVWPFAKVGDKYDLERMNDEYWRRFEEFLEETAKRDIIVQIELWDRFDFAREPWQNNPFNPKNNINYTAQESGLKERIDTHPGLRENAFFRTVPSLENNQVVLKYQQAFVDKLLSISLRYGHVLYCIDNETNEDPRWPEYWAHYIRRRAEEMGVEVHVTEMWDPWDLAHPMHDNTFKHPEIYTFVDISQNNHQKGQRHYDNALKRRVSIADNPRPMNNVKIYGADTGRFGTTRDGVERFWRNIFCGCASARFHRPPSGIGLSELGQRMIKAAREVTSAFDIFSCEPRNDLLGDREENEAYCLAEPGRQYAVYFPNGGEVTLNLKEAPSELTLRWYDIDNLRWSAPRAVRGGGTLKLKTPGSGQWAAVITRLTMKGGEG